MEPPGIEPGSNPVVRSDLLAAYGAACAASTRAEPLALRVIPSLRAVLREVPYANEGEREGRGRSKFPNQSRTLASTLVIAFGLPSGPGR